MRKNIKEIQVEVDNYIQQFKSGYFSPLGQVARLTEEMGELAREINHQYGEKKKKSTEQGKEIAEELGDVFFVLVCLANSLDIDLTESIDSSLEKFNTRDKNRFERKEEK